jgi:uncharacterized protein
VDLVISDRQGVEIDYCPACRGVWLDRGELDKIIDRIVDTRDFSTRAEAPPVDPRAPRPATQDRPRRHDRDDDDRDRKKKKRLGWLDELFDFD